MNIAKSFHHFVLYITWYLNNDLVGSWGLLGLAEDVDVPARLVCIGVSICAIRVFVMRRNVLAIKGVL